MQTADTMIVCTLSASALQERVIWIRRVTSESLVSHGLEGTTLTLTYRRQAKPELEKIVEGEQQCCAFLRFSMRELADTVELEIQAPNGGGEARWLFDQFLPAAGQVAAPKACGCASGRCG